MRIPKTVKEAVESIAASCFKARRVCLFVKGGLRAIDPPTVDSLFSSGCVRRGRACGDEITLFKSVGHAIEDLVAAAAVYEGLSRQRV